MVAAFLPSPPHSASPRSCARSWAIRDETSSSEKEEVEGAASEAAEGDILKLFFFFSSLSFRKKRERKWSETQNSRGATTTTTPWSSPSHQLSLISFSARSRFSPLSSCSRLSAARKKEPAHAMPTFFNADNTGQLESVSRDGTNERKEREASRDEAGRPRRQKTRPLERHRCFHLKLNLLPSLEQKKNRKNSPSSGLRSSSSGPRSPASSASG